MQRRCLTVALANLLLVPALLPLRVQATTNALLSPAAAEEISLASMNLMPQVVHGQSASLDVRFPPPVAGLAASGSYLRIFFAHSPLVGAGSSLRMLVNGQLLDEVALTPSTAAGAVFVLEVQPGQLHPDEANVVEFAFSLVTAAAAGGLDLYGRVDAETALHYQLGATAGTIEAHPYSLLGGSLAGALADVPLGLVTPAAPDDQEFAAALRLVADAGRRLRGARVRISLVSEAQESWLRSGGSPALVVGRVGALPGIGSLLSAAGFAQSAGGWTAPGARAPVAADDGIIAAVVSPWDGRSPVLVVTGVSDSGVARAAAAVVDSRVPPMTAHAAVVTQPAGVGPAETPDVPLRTLLPQHLAIHGPGDHVIAFGVPVPAIGGSFPATMRLTMSLARSSAAGGTSPDPIVEVGGQPVGAQWHAVTPGGQVATAALDIRGELRPGMNGVTMNLRLPDGIGDAQLDTEVSNARPLPSAGVFSRLDQLPDPFLDAPGDTQPAVALADMQPATLSGAVAAVAALGSRAVVAPAPLSVVVLGKDQLPQSAASVLVIGGPAGQALRLSTGALGTEVIYPPTAAADGGSGWIAELGLPAGVSALWVGGEPATLAATGMALENTSLRGQLAIVPQSGAPRDLVGASAGSAIEPPTTGLAHLLPLIAGVLLLGLLAMEVGRQRRRPR